MDFDSYLMSTGYTDEKVITINQTITSITSGIKSITQQNGNQLVFTLNDDSIITLTVVGLSQENYSTTEKNKLSLLNSDILSQFTFVNGDLLFNGNKVENNKLDLSNYYTQSQINTLLNNKANIVHTHPISDISNLSTELLNRYTRLETLSKTEIETLINSISKGMNWKESIDLLANLPMTSNNLTDTRVCVETSHIYIWNGTMWVDLGGSSNIPLATETLNGQMSKEDKIKLDSIVLENLVTLTQLNDALSLKLSKNNIKAGDNISLNIVGNDITINSSSSGGFLNVKGLGMTIADGGNEAIISFTNPASDNIDKIYLYVSYLEDLSNQSYEYVSANATLLSNSFIITSGAINTFNLPINDNNLNKNAYVKVFVGYGGTDYSSGSSINQVLSDTTPTLPVTNIAVTQLTKSSVKLTWTNPSQTDLKNVNVLMKYDATINDVYDGTIVYTGSSNTCTITGLDEGKHIYFRFYTLDKSDNIQSNVSQIADILLDNIAPNEVTNFSVLSGFSVCKLKFSDSSSTDWKMSKIVRKVGGEPTSIDDGTLVLTNTTKDSYKNNYFIDGGLSNGLSYYYKIYSIDNFGNISSGVSQVGNPVATSLPEVSNFKIENIENGIKQKISWTNSFAPSGLTYVERQLFYSKDQTVALDTLTRDQCIAEPLIASLSLGAGTGQGIDDNFTTSSALTKGDISRYKVFIHYDSSGTPVWSSGTYDIKEVKDETPLSDVTGLVTTASDSQCIVSWINPNTSMDNDFSKVQIYRKIGTYPDGNNDLEKIYESTNKNAGNLNTFTDSGLTNNTIYYYLIKLIDLSGNINVNTKFTLTPVPLPVYSISYNSSTKTWTRGGLATSMSVSDFNSISPYKDIKRVLLTDAKVKTYLKSTDSTMKEDGTSAILDGTQGNVFSEIPKFYYKYEYDGTSIHKWTIANSSIGGCTLHPAFIRNSDNKDYLYIGSYKGYVNGTKLESRSGIVPTTNSKSFSDFITLAEARGTGFTQFDSLSLHVLQLLFIMQYANPDTSTVLGGGQDLGNVLTTGGTNSLGNATGKVGNYSSLYGIENIFGESHNVVTGLIAGSKYFQANNSFSSMTSEASTGTYTQLSTATPISTNGFIGDIEPINSAFIAKNTSASSTTGFCDYQLSKNGSNLNVLLMGGSALADQRGLFNNEFVDVSVMSSTNNMTNEGVIDTYTAWSVSVDKTAYGIKSISSFSLVDGTTPAIQTNLSINNLSGRLIAY